MIKYSKSIYKKVLKGKYYKNYRRRKIIEKNNEKPEFDGNNREICRKADDKRICSDVLPFYNSRQQCADMEIEIQMRLY